MENKVYSLQELKDNIHSLVKDLPVYSVVLFGSYAKGNADSALSQPIEEGEETNWKSTS
jgi:predicted nucleotidyltransferase